MGHRRVLGETADDASYFNHPGVAITASSGDSGYGVEYPAASRYVTAVGGTTLSLGSGGSYGGESVWSGSGSGCSVYETKPAWQTDTGCSQRTVADVSADADPNTGAAIYDSVSYYGQTGWFQVGGTSLSSPLVAVGLRAHRQRRRGLGSLRAASAPARRHVRLERQLLADLPLHWRRRVTTGRPGSARRTASAPSAGGPVGAGLLARRVAAERRR